jgi:Ca2+-binding EF-hand superfamily protein
MTLHADRVHDIFGQTLTGGDSVQNFYRLFGDADGNGYVSTDELALFRSVLNKKSTDAAYLAYFDFDGDGTITTADYAQFNKRLGKRI